MTATYDPSEPTTRDKVRGRIGEIATMSTVLPDETIDAVLAEYPGVLLASVICLRRFLAATKRDTDRSAIGISDTLSQAFAHGQEVLKALEHELASSASIPLGPGISLSAATTAIQNTDARGPTFRLGRFDNPRRGRW